MCANRNQSRGLAHDTPVLAGEADRMRRQFVLHVGIHKTGSTSIQSFLNANRERLRACDIDFYEGHHIASNHVELHAAAMREDRSSPFKLDNDLTVDAAYRSATAARLNDQLARSTSPRILFSAEGLSYLRHPDEMARLKALLPGDDIRIIFYVRDRNTFLSSYRGEMERHRLPAVIDRDSFAYVADDSWLADFNTRIDAFRSAFGRASVTVVDYDREMRRTGNIIPSFLRSIGVEGAFEQDSWSDIFKNRRASAA